MTIQDPTLVTYLVGTMALLIIVQTALLVLAISHLIKGLQQLDQSLEFLSQKSAKVLEFADGVASLMEKASRKLPEIEKVIQEMMGNIAETTEKANQALEHRLDFLHSHMEKVQSGMDVVLSKFSQQTFKVHSAFLQPSMRLFAIIRAGIITLKQALSREDGSPASHLPDEEGFI